MGGVLVLASGGIDSTVLLHMALRDQKLDGLITYDYGQPAKRIEQLAVETWFFQHWRCRASSGDGIWYQTRELSPLWSGSADSKMGDPSGAPGPRVVPGRNLAMLLDAVLASRDVAPSLIWYGAIADDQRDYADCRPEFITAFNNILARSGFSNVFVEAPLIRLSKAEVIAKAVELDVDIDGTISCYNPIFLSTPEERITKGYKFARSFAPCGGCNSCVARREGLQAWGRMTS